MLYWLVLFAGSDPAQIALALRAQADFDRVELASKPAVADASACVQSQAAVLPVTAPQSLSLIHYRRGYCALVGALISRERRGFEDAAASFERAIAAWPLRVRDRKAPPEPLSAGLTALLGISRLSAGAPDSEWPALEARLDEARRSAACPADVMPAELCRQLLWKAGAWEGWIAVRQGRTARAQQMFAAVPASGWNQWLAGRRAYENRRYREAAESFRLADAAWSAAERNPAASIPAGLDPPGDLAAARIDLAQARIAAGDPKGALGALDPAVRNRTASPWVYFLRGRARDESGDAAGAAGEYGLAARAALAAGEAGSGDARFYRAVWLYRRSEFPAAEEEFVDAMNDGLLPPAASDAPAWRALAAVASGACDASRGKLAASLGTASPLFPSAEAKRALEACDSSPRAVSEVR